MHVQSEEQLFLSFSRWHGCTSRQSTGGSVLLTQDAGAGLGCFEIGNTKQGSNFMRKNLHFLPKRIAQAIRY